MPTRPIHTLRKDPTSEAKTFQTSAYHHPQHGHQHSTESLLLDVPAESLTHITSYLTPPSLLTLATTCRSLYEHVKDDNTWLRAFLNQFLSISPERELENEKILSLKRMENTWRKEFILRYSFRRRWERSRNPTLTHTPQDSTIDGVHLMSDNGLLTSSIQYGIVARSLPLSGKILKGYIDASGTGLGIGNPNAEFTPNVSACAMLSDGGTARVFWGKRNGEVAVTVANKVMDSGRAVPRFIRCSVNDQHESAVQQLLPDPTSNTLVSAGADGRVNLWDLRTLALMWSSGKQQVSLVADPIISIAGSLSEGFIAGALNSGDVLLFNLEVQDTTGEHLTFTPRQLRVTAPIHGDNHQPPAQTAGSAPEQRIAKTWLYRSTESSASLFVQYSNHSLLYRVFADMQSGQMTITCFGDSSFGSISVVELVTSTQERDGNTVIIGDHLGFISIYDANVPLSSQFPIAPVHKFEAHTDGGVTAISWSPMVFATGSARGTTTVWDTLTLSPLRYFMSPAPRPAPGHDWDGVSQVLLDKELVVIIVGNRAMTWNLGQARGREHKHKKTKHSHSKKSLTSKGQKQYEMHKDIHESFGELEYERAHVQRRYGHEREHRSTLDSLGLSELEAVEYVLMLSRQEEEDRQLTMAREECAFEGDFDDFRGTSWSQLSTQVSSHASSSSSTCHSDAHQYPRIVHTSLNEKAQVSPPFVPEPMEAGTTVSPLRSLTTAPGTPCSAIAMRSTSSSSLEDFPIISPTLSSISSSRGMSAPHLVSSSPDRSRSAWCTPLQSNPPSPGPSAPHSCITIPVVAMSHLSADIAQNKTSKVEQNLPDSEEMDDDLRLAIELSLAEACSRGEEV
ncbi:hypothetical protein PAXRUDRAFT_831680 [Paxillus rubicundulus Ve08.2h10]|uniref:F-box domain-containing protein n=1 Tax=Paxillus rubicundulus Ve08.2h10 TaxID=930991 RepID=A0A0D0DRP3_9AGAM|nr:hypothetical protein PAXRUDRAFT_831680 [Paxillus rubicundulus Ve08.2h10]